MSEEPAVRRGGTSGRTGRRPRRAPRRTPGGSADNRRTPVPEEQLARRRALVPEITYPEDLPVSRAPRRHRRGHPRPPGRRRRGRDRVGQDDPAAEDLPRAGSRASRATIGHTQPRRIAARAVAERVAEELGVELGGAVGYQVRFADHSSRDTLVKVMTDGILLAELQRDRDLRRYDTIIIDEAHERSLNVDFLLGYLKRLLPRRPDLKVIITSATIDPQRFADHFAAPGRPVPVVEVSGRTYPVEVRYRPLEREEEGAEPVDQVTGIVEAVEELWTESRGDGGSQDILVFLSGEREIRDGAEALSALNLPATEVLPLFGRLSAAEQHRVFSRHERAADRVVHQRRRDVADRPGHPLRRRHRDRAHLALQPAHQGPAAADRADQPGQREPAVRPLRAARRRRLHPPVRRGGLPRAAGVHRARDPAHHPRLGHPPDDESPAGRRRPLPVRRPAGRPADRRRRAAAGGAAGRRRRPPTRKGVGADGSSRHTGNDWRGCRSTRDSGGWCSRRTGSAARARCSSSSSALSHPGPARAPARQAGAGRPVAQAVRGRALRLRRIPATSGATSRSSRKPCPHSAFRRMCKAEFLHYLRIREWQDLHAAAPTGGQSAGLDTSTQRPPGRARLGHHPQGAARRPALARRVPRRGEARVPRRAGRPLRHQSRVPACSASSPTS